jgi:hypothetical protein
MKGMLYKLSGGWNDSVENWQFGESASAPSSTHSSAKAADAMNSFGFSLFLPLFFGP